MPPFICLSAFICFVEELDIPQSHSFLKIVALMENLSALVMLLLKKGVARYKFFKQTFEINQRSFVGLTLSQQLKLVSSINQNACVIKLVLRGRGYGYAQSGKIHFGKKILPIFVEAQKAFQGIIAHLKYIFLIKSPLIVSSCR